MKRFAILLFTAIVTFTVGFNADAQTSGQEDQYRQSLTNIFVKGDVGQAFDGVLDMMVGLFKMAGTELSDSQAAELRTGLKNKLVDLMLPVYMENVSLEDIQAMEQAYNSDNLEKSLQEFNATPAGRRVQAAESELTAGMESIKEPLAEWLIAEIERLTE